MSQLKKETLRWLNQIRDILHCAGKRWRRGRRLCTMYDVRLRCSRALRGKTTDGGKCVWTARMRCPAGVKTGDGCKPVWPKALAFAP